MFHHQNDFENDAPRTPQRRRVLKPLNIISKEAHERSKEKMQKAKMVRFERIQAGRQSQMENGNDAEPRLVARARALMQDPFIMYAFNIENLDPGEAGLQGIQADLQHLQLAEAPAQPFIPMAASMGIDRFEAGFSFFEDLEFPARDPNQEMECDASPRQSQGSF